MNSNTYLHIFKDSDEVTSSLSQWWQEETIRLKQLHQPVSWALSGGRTPLSLYQKLAQAPHMPWESLQVFLVDERDVDQDHNDSNYKLCQTAGLCQKLTSEQFLPMRQNPLDATSPEKSCLSYQQKIEALPSSSLDLALLGMGADGHTASLFPGTSEADKTLDANLLSQDPYVISHELPQQPLASLPSKWRISLTYRALIQAREVVFLITGQDKAARLLEIFTQKDSPSPCAKLWRYRQSIGLSTRWYLDEAAASLLVQEKAI